MKLCKFSKLIPTLPDGVMQSWACPACQTVIRTTHSIHGRECVPSPSRPFKSPTSKPAPLPEYVTPNADCCHRGEKLREQGCKPCQAAGKKQIDVFACDLHGECTLHNTAIQPRIRACATCQEHVSISEFFASKPQIDDLKFTGPIVRNLLMFIYPVRGDVSGNSSPQAAEWRRNVEKILQRIHLFNGKRIFAVAVDAASDSLETVKTALTGIDCEILPFVNDTKLGEVIAFKSLLSQVESTDQNEITFYCHAKGVTKQHNSTQLPFVRRWADAMYDVLLDGVGDVESVLETKTFAAAFRTNTKQFPSGEITTFNWHFPGTFFWFRNRTIFKSSRWKNISQTYWGSESWPGTQVPIMMTSCLLVDEIKLGELYSEPIWNRIQPMLEKWKGSQFRKIPKVSNEPSYVIGNSWQLLKLTDEERRYLDSARFVFTCNYFAEHWRKAGFRPTHWTFGDTMDQAGCDILKSQLDAIRNDPELQERLKHIFVCDDSGYALDKSMAEQVRQIVADSGLPITMYRREEREKDNRGFAHSIHQPFWRCGTLLDAFNQALIMNPGNPIRLLGCQLGKHTGHFYNGPDTDSDPLQIVSWAMWNAIQFAVDSGIEVIDCNFEHHPDHEVNFRILRGSVIP